ncbi:MAG: hemerythrin domain-containing protein [Solirubrobacteraceae bacterium]
MKRSEALAILSRDHHQALFVASRLRRADAETAAAACERFRGYWQPAGNRHFRLEEELLLPAYARYGDPRHPLVLRALGDHVDIRGQAQRLLEQAEPSLEALHELGASLAAHVRLEERQLFGIIEQVMPADELLAIAQALEGAEAGEEP